MEAVTVIVPVLTISGLIFGLLGIVIRVLPVISRRIRNTVYSVLPNVKTRYRLFKDIENSDRGIRFTVRDKRVRKEFIDYVEKYGNDSPPNQVPREIRNGADRIEVTYPDGSTDEFFRGAFSQEKLADIVYKSIEKSCRNWGTVIAIIGTGVAVLGVIL
ncbi:hypothetical protein [Haloarchaeobius baliensis]|uniref:hypothetical protein n=1 Tax=Haloarchaeobius baliensis TaxID=1670458 RepID=UPI003F880676